MAEFNDLVGETIISFSGLEKGSEVIIFNTSTGIKYKMFHDQVCCESVSVEDIHGNISDILDSKITHAEVVTNSDENPDDVSGDILEDQRSFTWTYYYIRTDKGSLSILWYGLSNGYYSEKVNFEKVKI